MAAYDGTPQPPPRLIGPSVDISPNAVSEKLCLRCSRLNISGAKKPCDSNTGELIAALGPRSEAVKDHGCSLCLLLDALLPPQTSSSTGDDNELFVLVRYPTDYIYVSYNTHFATDPVAMFGILPQSQHQKHLHHSPKLLNNGYLNSPARAEGYILPFTKHRGSDQQKVYVRQLGPMVDWDLVGSWIDYCKKHHEAHCIKGRRTFSKPSVVTHLIDCKERRIIRVWRPVKYLALSYVWGATRSEDAPGAHHGAVLPKAMSKTVDDGIIATLRLGYQYLWVDRYCIPRDDENASMAQIASMDVVYREAEATLIACAGEDASHGLPGVGSTARTVQRSARIGKQTLVWTMADPAYLIRKSKWITRGWTYQEGLLSRRCIYFTVQQVYFECAAMHHCEALCVPVRKSRISIGAVAFRNNHQVWRRRGLFDGAHRWDARDLVRLLGEYRLRELTFDYDVVNAFLGVLRAFEVSGKDSIQHYWGVPLLPPVYRVYWNRGNEIEVEETTRSDGGDFAAGLCWEMDGPCSRRPGFPSWSWAGWTGKMKVSREWGYPYEMEAAIRVELPSGQTRDVGVLVRSGSHKQYGNGNSQVLVINTWTISLTISGRTESTPLAPVVPSEQKRRDEADSPEEADDLWVEFIAEDGLRLFSRPHLLSQELIETLCKLGECEGYACTGILFQDPSVVSDKEPLMITLVNKTCDDGPGERIGHVRAGVNELHVVKGEMNLEEVENRQESLVSSFRWVKQTLKLM